MKKALLILAIALMVFAFGARKASAATTQNIVITISINAVVDIAINETTWDLSASNFSGQYATGPYVITNNGGTSIDLKIIGANSSTANWTMAGATGTNLFTVKALIGSNTATTPIASKFGLDGVDTLNNATDVVATAADLGDTTWEPTNGAAVPAAAVRRLFLQFSMPGAGFYTAGNIGNVTLTVGANVL